MLHFREKLPSFGQPVFIVPGLMGLGVAAFWLMLIPEDPSASELFALELFSASPWLATAWLLVRLIGAYCIVPVVEELAFRGYLLTWISKKVAQLQLPVGWMTWAPLLISAVLFGLFHEHSEVAALSGLAFGWVYLRRMVLADAILAHATANATIGLFVLLSVHWSYW